MLGPAYKPHLQVDWDTVKEVALTLAAVAGAVTACVTLATVIRDSRKKEDDEDDPDEEEPSDDHTQVR
jgi:hypothetical protein